MKKYFILFLIIIGSMPSIYSAQEVNLKKVDDYVKDMTGFIIKYNDYIEEKATPENVIIAEKEIDRIFDKYKLNDDEVFEVLNIATKEHDVQKIVNIWSSGDTSIPYDKDIALKYNIFEITKGHYFEIPWFSLPGEEVLMNKILPILNKSKNPAVIRYYINNSGGMFMDISGDKKLSISDENRAKFSDKYLEIFKDENNLSEIRQSAFEAWISSESRSKEATEIFDLVFKDENLFVTHATRFLNVSRKIRRNYYKKEKINKISNIDERMFDILENSDLYSLEIKYIVAKYFKMECDSYDEKTKNRLNNILQNKIKKEKNQDLVKEYIYILDKRLKDKYNLFFGLD